MQEAKTQKNPNRYGVLSGGESMDGLAWFNSEKKEDSKGRSNRETDGRRKPWPASKGPVSSPVQSVACSSAASPGPGWPLRIAHMIDCTREGGE